ncbi:MAG: hypothetical protein QOE05_2586 [Actinomycetota bacterium]|nr:hypothetical protein [Actinomycetota bacterium]
MFGRARLPLVAVALAALVPTLTAAGGASAAKPGTAPAYTEYDMGFTGGEPVISFEPDRNATYYAAGLTTLKLGWDEKGTMTKTDVSPPFSPETLDTILETDEHTGRTFVSYLALACSVMAYTDDGGESWQQSEGCGPGAAVDHQSVGAGALHAPLTAGPTGYEGAVYYCAQDAYNGMCAVSLDGGVTFGPGVPVANTPANKVGDPLGGSCSALHGHLKVGPDGTAYLPLKGCDGIPTLNNATNSEFFGGRPSLTVSEDNGATWTVRFGPEGSHNPDESDPDVVVGPEGTLYFAWQDGTNPSDAVGGDETAVKVATSTDGGKTWSEITDLSTPLGLHNVQFPNVMVGDDDRASVAFIGTPGVGNDQDDAFRGDWHLYVSTTYDAGQTWTTVDATPKNLINRGCVHMLGLAPGSQRTDDCSFRNMLDFNDITVDNEGRLLVAYTDACAAECSAKDGENADARDLRVLRQSCGRGLYAAKDAVLTTAKTCALSSTGPAVVVPRPGTGARPGTARPPAAIPSTGMPQAVGVAALLLLLGAVALRRRSAV